MARTVRNRISLEHDLCPDTRPEWKRCMDYRSCECCSQKRRRKRSPVRERMKPSDRRRSME